MFILARSTTRVYYQWNFEKLWILIKQETPEIINETLRENKKQRLNSNYILIIIKKISIEIIWIFWIGFCEKRLLKTLWRILIKNKRRNTNYTQLSLFSGELIKNT